MQTKCLNCGKVLTSEEGHRLASVIADSSLPHKPMEKDVTWLRCEECHAVAVNRGEGPRQQHASRPSHFFRRRPHSDWDD
jgi:5-methylcytosine-specific restriction endonuclease McrA